MTETLMDINGLTKAYPGVVANNNVSFQIRIGEDHAFLREIDYEKNLSKPKICAHIATHLARQRCCDNV